MKLTGNSSRRRCFREFREALKPIPKFSNLPKFPKQIIFNLQLKFVFLHQIRMIMRFKEGYKVRSMAGENVVIMQGTAGSDMTRIISLNDSSLLLWNALQGKEFEVSDVATLLVEEYGIDTATATADAQAWVDKLAECGLTE